MIEKLARLGYAAKGVVYAIIGLLALGAVFGRSSITNHEGAFFAILRQPFGNFLLYLVALGLLGYALWRVVQAITDPERRGRDAKAILTRIVLFVRGVVHGYLAIEVFRIATARVEGDGGAQHWTSRVMEKPFGPWLVAIGGIAIAGYGVGQIIAAAMGKIDKRLPQRPWFVRFGRLGLASRGVVFAIIGWFLIAAGRRHDPSQARDIGGALRELSEPWLLAMIAVGLLAYGMYELVKARYKRIVSPLD